MPKPTPLELVDRLDELARQKRRMHSELRQTWTHSRRGDATWDALLANGRDTADVLRQLRDSLTPAVEREPMDDEDVSELIRESRLD